MACRCIISGPCKPAWLLLLTIVVCLCGSRVLAAVSDVPWVTFSSITENSITVQWTAAPGTVTGYNVSYTNGTTTVDATAGNNLQYTINSLSPGVTYNVTVYTLNDTDRSPGVSNTTTTFPSPVINLQGTASEAYVNLTWTPPNDIHSSDYSYTVIRMPGNLNKTGIKSTSVQMMGLSPGITYTFSVYSVTSNGVQSRTNDSITITTFNPVSQVTLSSVTETSITVQWTAAPGTVTGYKVSYTNGTTTVDTNVGNTLQYTINSLSPGVTYNVTVYTLNGILTSPGVSNTTTTLPSAVSNFHVTDVRATYVNLTWTPPMDDNSSTYSYNITWNPGNHFLIVNHTNSAHVPELLPGVPYTFTIYTLTATGERSSTGLDAQNTTLPSTVLEVRITNVLETNVNLSWTPPLDVYSSFYKYSVIVTSMPDNKTMNDTAAPPPPIVVDNLLPGVPYTFTVYTLTNTSVRSFTGLSNSTTTLPSPVSDLHVSEVQETNMTLTWTAPNDTYKNYYTYTVTGMPGNIHISNITTTHKQVTGLVPGVTYTFIVYTVTQNLVQSRSGPNTTVTTLPSAASGFHASEVHETYISLVWTAPNNTNKNDYTYTVTTMPGNIHISNITTTYTQVTGLDPGVTYTFTLYTVTQNNQTSSGPSIRVTTLPSPGQNLQVTDVQETYVNLTWTAPNNINSNTYTYTVTGVSGRNVTDIKTQSTQVPGLNPGVTYTFTVYTVTADKVSSSSGPYINITTLPSPVQDLLVSDVQVNSVNLTWMAPTNINSKTYTYNVSVTSTVAEASGQNTSRVGTNFTQVSGLAAGVTYTFTVYTLTQDLVQSNKYLTTTNTTLPNAPTNMNANAPSQSSLFIEWTRPIDINAAFYEYGVYWYNATTEIGQNFTNATNSTITNLNPGNLYRIELRSVYKNGLSGVVSVNQRTMPISTQNFMVTNTTQTSATLSWDLQNYPNSIVSGFRVQVFFLNGTLVKDETIGVSSTKSYTVSGLEPGFIYEFNITSYANSTTQGRSVNSDPSAPIFSLVATARGETVPDQVTSISCSKVDGYKIYVQFACPKGNYSSFEVLVNKKRSVSGNCTDKILVTNLQPAQGYQIEVQTLGTMKDITTEPIQCYTDNTAVIVGSVLGILLFLLLIAIIAYFVMRKRRTKGEAGTMHVISKRRYPTIPKEKFRQHYDSNHANTDFGFAEEYQELSTVGTSQPKRAAELPENRAKNRFTNVLPYDHSRVKLSITDGNPASDYINANYIPGYNSTKEFIASQGPLPSTTADFWRMVWEHHVNTIVMLTNCMENGRVKCEHYWPLDYTPCTYEDITVTVTSETILSEWTIRDFSLKNAKQQGVKYVRHFHFTAWPDHGVPESTSSITQFRNLVREYMDARRSTGPTIVHCSAGVGRTGTLIALDYLIQQMEKEQRVGIYGFVEKMRLNRNLMVQTEAQYIFLNKCMLDLIEQPEDPIYENQPGKDLIYENASVVRNFQHNNA
ncbi:receptor-type tyrosine-protein phosphatase H isoform X3 [Hyperolius riggenbachi]|uniref:receptor-type tyrosine-protein phosphatase H isoform X3 n=1 Tax=Hyperolius riggenbachi TaxID=752182 RepID=UPI0035A32E5D